MKFINFDLKGLKSTMYMNCRIKIVSIHIACVNIEDQAKTIIIA